MGRGVEGGEQTQIALRNDELMEQLHESTAHPPAAARAGGSAVFDGSSQPRVVEARRLGSGDRVSPGGSWRKVEGVINAGNAFQAGGMGLSPPPNIHTVNYRPFMESQRASTQLTTSHLK